VKRNVHCSIIVSKSEEPLTRYSQKSLHCYLVRSCDSNFDEIASVH